MSFLRQVKGRLFEWRAALVQRRVLAGPAPTEGALEDWARSLADPTGYYRECYRYFHQRLPPELREHRHYFTQERRGFGEDAFHVLWWMLCRRFKPANFLEIGVYRGQTISLVALLAKLAGRECAVHGISPFTSAGDSVSRYLTEVDYHADTLANFHHFNLRKPHLVRAFSTDPEAQQYIRSRVWPVIYIDGNHDYEVAHQDWELCAANLAPRGVIVLDDAGLTTSYQAPVFATAGHPGPSRLAHAIDRDRFQEILQVGHNRVFQRVD
jgi:Methyltransferase domain